MNGANYLLGVDIGTYSAKGVLVDLDGTIRATHTVDYTMSIPEPGWAEHDADDIWWSSFVQISQKLLEDTAIAPEAIAAVGCSAIGITMLPVDIDGTPLRPSILYGIDTRAWREVASLTETLGEDAILASSNSRLSANSVGPKILWFRNNEPELFARTHKILTASSYLAYKLTGEFTIDTYSAQGFAPLYDAHRQEWNAEMAKPICSLDLLPSLHGATEVVGEVDDGAAAQTGLAAGTPVIAGTVDAAAEAISIGVTSPGETMLMLGTTAFITQVLGDDKRHEGLWTARFLAKDTYAMSAGMATSAALTRWFKDNFAAAEVQSEESGGAAAYESLAQQAANVPVGSAGLIVLPYFSGERAPIHDVNARGLLAGLTLSHTRSHVYRALLEGVAYAIRHNLAAMAEIDATPSRLVAVGGGTKNETWLQIIADCTGHALSVPAKTVGASYGDAYLAGIGVGIFNDFGTLRDQWVQIDRSIEPIPEHHDVYSNYFDIYLRSYKHMKRELHELATLQDRTRSQALGT